MRQPPDSTAHLIQIDGALDGVPRRIARPKRFGAAVAAGLLVALAIALPTVNAEAAPPVSATTINPDDVPAVLQGNTWLQHHAEDLMPYWDMPEALGDPIGNFPSFRDRAGELLPDQTTRGLSTLARCVYGYSLAFMLTGEERYLTYAKAGLDWINAKAKDPVYGGYFGELDINGNPVNPQANKDIFDLASLGLAYGMYYNVTRDPAAEADLLAVRDLIFNKYYDAAGNRFKDSLTYDLSTEVDTGNNGGDITNLLVPGTAVFLPNADILTDPARRAQFHNDLRLITQSLIDRHKNSAAAANRWWFWGRTARFGNFNALQTDFGHNIKSYEMIYNANQTFPDRPWEGLSADRTTLMERAWDDPATRWNQRLRNFNAGNAEPDSAWWIHDEADQTLAALDFTTGYAYSNQLARSAQSYLNVFVDHDPAYPGEVFARIERTGTFTDLRKSFFGKAMLHAHEHALIMYLHGRAMEGKPAKLYYAFPENQTLTAVAKPYWFDSAGQSRTVGGNVSVLPGHRVVEVSFTGLDNVVPEPYPAPDDAVAPTTAATVSPAANDAGWNRGDTSVSLSATDGGVGVRHIYASVVADGLAVPDAAFIDAGGEFTLPNLTVDGNYTITFYSVDLLGNTEEPQTIRVNVDLTDPQLACEPVPTFVLGGPGSVSATVTDAGSGPVTPLVTAAVDTSSVGTASVLLTAQDIAGRSGSADCDYRVNYGFSGFDSPVDPEAVNVAKAGSVLPLKWRLVDYYGNPFTDLSSVTVLSIRHSCEQGAEEDPVEELAAGASGLQNLGDGYYQLNWKSSKAYADSCRTLELHLGEAEPRTAEFRFSR